ncbi:MAG: DUF7504 family protein [Candidatus Helarchaeota archaeon]
MDVLTIIRNIIYISTFPIFITIVTLKYRKEKNYEKFIYYVLFLIAITFLGAVNLLYAIISFLEEFSFMELSMFLVRIHHVFYYLGLSFFGYFLMEIFYESKQKLLKYAEFFLIALCIMLTVTFFVLPINPNLLRFDFSNPLVLTTIVFVFSFLIIYGILFTNALFFKLKVETSISRNSLISNILMISGAWIIGIVSSSTYVISFDLPMLILLIGDIIFLSGYVLHEPFKILVEHSLKILKSDEFTMDNEKFRQEFGFILPKNAQILLVHKNIKLKNEFFSKLLVNFKESGKTTIFIAQKGKIYQFPKGVQNSKLTVFEYCVNGDSLGEINDHLIRISIDLSILYETIKTANSSLKNEEYYLIFDSITDLINWYGFKSIYSFLRKVIDLLKTSKAIGIFSIHSKAHEETEFNSIKNSFDAILQQKGNDFELTSFY